MKPHKLAITINGVTHNTLSSLYKSNRFIYFGPEDIQVITGAPEEKRRFLDQTISQRNPYYLQALIMYKKLLKERNALLFQKNDPTLFSLYNEQLAKSGMEILKQRRTFFNEIEKEFTRLYETIGKDTLQLRLHYNPSLNCTSLQEYKEILDISLEKDRELGYTSVGIHRDTYSCKTETIKMVGFGSQGQLRTAALSLKLASLVYLLHESSEPVIVAIDDAFSELDISRKKRFFKELQHEKVQLFMTIHSPEEASHYTLPLFYVTTEKGVYRAS